MTETMKCVEVPAVPYLAWHADAQVRHRRGERQKQCKFCGLWFWEHEMKLHRPVPNE